MPGRPRYCYEVVHEGYRPMHIRMLGLSLRPLRFEHQSFRLCSHPEHSSHLAGFPELPKPKDPGGWAVTIIRVGTRRRIIKTAYMPINRPIRQRVAAAMRLTARQPARRP